LYWQKIVRDPGYFHQTASDPWRWSAATGADIQDIVDLVLRNYQADGAGITDINPVEGSRNLMFAIVNQMYAPKKEMITVARLKDDGTLVGFTWAHRDQRHPWSTEEMIMPRMLSVDLTMTARCRVALCYQAMFLWERWAQLCDVKCIASNNMRTDWSALMHMHKNMGYDVRGSMAFKRLKDVKVAMSDSKIILP
jgi:hypothetical protein